MFRWSSQREHPHLRLVFVCLRAREEGRASQERTSEAASQSVVNSISHSSVFVIFSQHVSGWAERSTDASLPHFHLLSSFIPSAKVTAAQHFVPLSAISRRAPRFTKVLLFKQSSLLKPFQICCDERRAGFF